MNKARNAIGLYALTKKVRNLYLGETARGKVTFFCSATMVMYPTIIKLIGTCFSHVAFEDLRMMMNQMRICPI
eukprot:125979-Ditylum_brightwellii.AAC.1